MIQREEQQHVFPQMPCQEKIPPDVFPAVLLEPLRVVGGVQELFDHIGGPFDGAAQKPAILVLDLERYAAHTRCCHRLSLPERLRYRQPEPFADLSRAR